MLAKAFELQEIQSTKEQREFLLSIEMELKSKHKVEFHEYPSFRVPQGYVRFLKIYGKLEVNSCSAFLTYSCRANSIFLYYGYNKSEQHMNHRISYITEAFIDWGDNYISLFTKEYKDFVKELSNRLQYILKPNSIRFIKSLCEEENYESTVENIIKDLNIHFKYVRDCKDRHKYLSDFDKDLDLFIEKIKEKYKEEGIKSL